MFDQQFAHDFPQVSAGNFFHKARTQMCVFSDLAAHVDVYTIYNLPILAGFAADKADVTYLRLSAGVGTATPVNSHWTGNFQIGF
jgi:hypothetical protein